MKCYRKLKDVPDWARPSVEKAVRLGVIQQSDQGLMNVYEPNLKTIVQMDRLGLLDGDAADAPREVAEQ